MEQVLIIDDEEHIRDLLSEILGMNGFNCVKAANALEARNILKTQSFELVLCDITMPGESGLDFIQYAAKEFPDTATIMITALDDPLIASHALQLGVYDYITKPFEMNGVLISVANALRRRELEVDNRAYQKQLEQKVEERTTAFQESMEKWRKAVEGIIRSMALTLEMRDPYTAGHQQRVASLVTAITEEMGFSHERTEGARMAAMIHDIGKISVPAEILSKPGVITEIEFSLIKTHPQIGYEILEEIEFPWPIAQMVLQHHERIDGSGYPSALEGEVILLEAKIIGVADVVEAMASHRPYRPALGIAKAIEEIEKNRNTKYDPEVVDACLKVFSGKGFSFDLDHLQK